MAKTSFGGNSRVRYFKHEVSNWIRTRVRVDSGEPAAAPLPMPETPELISMREVEQLIGFSRVHLWRLEQAGKFPRRIRLSDDVADAA
jgi:predicted DNA-binding transcriptional regulator AlpA